MSDPTAFARLLTGWCLDVQPEQQIAIRSTTLAEPLLLALQHEIMSRGAWPLFRVDLPGQEEGFWAAAQDVHLDGFAPAELAEIEGTDASLRIQAPGNTSALSGVDPARIARAARARKPIKVAAMQRRWALTVWPTAALAQRAGMGTAAFAAVVQRALFLDRPDPVAAWQELSDRQDRLIEQLAGASEIRIEAQDTDLRLDVSGRTWINSNGKRNMPSGEVFTGPHESSANGTVRFTIPAAPPGVDVADVRLTFEDGKVVDARAERGEDYLVQTLDTDPGARRLGELGIGTNFGIRRPTGMILLDEKIGGTVHLAIGSSYPETGGLNESAVHWDLICDLRDGGRLTADGKPILVDGEFV